MATTYTKGLHELGDSCFAWLEPDGSWGWSNAGLVAGDGASILVDTLFDVTLTRVMLEGMRRVTTTKPITTVLNTHSNGDHWFGNQLLKDAEIIASNAAAAEMPNAGPERLELLQKVPGGAGDFAREIFSPFDWSDFDQTLPTRTFDGHLDLTVGGIDVQLIELGPAHTAGDTVAYVPSAKTLFTGDLLFIGGTPIIWAGPLSNWVTACDVMLALDVDTVVPGHGPVTDKSGIRQVRDYLTFVEGEARARFDAGMSARDATADINLGEYGTWASTAGWPRTFWPSTPSSTRACRGPICWRCSPASPRWRVSPELTAGRPWSRPSPTSAEAGAGGPRTADTYFSRCQPHRPPLASLAWR